jgi:hypothetical protein
LLFFVFFCFLTAFVALVRRGFDFFTAFFAAAFFLPLRAFFAGSVLLRDALAPFFFGVLFFAVLARAFLPPSGAIVPLPLPFLLVVDLSRSLASIFTLRFLS